MVDVCQAPPYLSLTLIDDNLNILKDMPKKGLEIWSPLWGCPAALLTVLPVDNLYQCGTYV